MVRLVLRSLEPHPGLYVFFGILGWHCRSRAVQLKKNVKNKILFFCRFAVCSLSFGCSCSLEAQEDRPGLVSQSQSHLACCACVCQCHSNKNRVQKGHFGLFLKSGHISKIRNSHKLVEMCALPLHNHTHRA